MRDEALRWRLHVDPCEVRTVVLAHAFVAAKRTFGPRQNGVWVNTNMQARYKLPFGGFGDGGFGFDSVLGFTRECGGGRAVARSRRRFLDSGSDTS